MSVFWIVLRPQANGSSVSVLSHPVLPQRTASPTLLMSDVSAGLGSAIADSSFHTVHSASHGGGGGFIFNVVILVQRYSQSSFPAYPESVTKD